LSYLYYPSIERPHILLLDEPTNSLDPESIDALAKAINEFEGGMVLVSHDMRLISQVAKEIWICDSKTINTYKGDILSFKLAMRSQMGLEDGNKQAPKALRGDASLKIKDETTIAKKVTSKKSPTNGEVTKVTKNTAKLETVSEQLTPLVVPKITSNNDTTDDATVVTTATTISASSNLVTSPSKTDTLPIVKNNDNKTVSSSPPPASVTPTTDTASAADGPVLGRYIPPHLRKKMMEEQQQQQQS
jgi:energy-coupling factor transporter ATP-binding protein EcfA2